MDWLGTLGLIVLLLGCAVLICGLASVGWMVWAFARGIWLGDTAPGPDLLEG